ncbi:MAG: DUF6786 family protein [Victivallaceae bacterium]
MGSVIQSIDKDAMGLVSGDGFIYVASGLQGRVFCELAGTLVHRLDVALAQNPHPVDFNNLGGNSLWPAPEGGDFAFNYLSGSDVWLVQPAINRECPAITKADGGEIAVAKNIELFNRKGCRVKVKFSRSVKVKDISTMTVCFGLKGVAYSSVDSFEPLAEYPANEVLLAAWSLEQFPGGENIIAFGKTAGVAAESINADFYGDPSDRMEFAGQMFSFRLGGKPRLQIGITRNAAPELIGAYDRERSLLIIRRTPVQDGLYINIADNAQDAGPFSATDMFSIFNGGELGFYELETIAPVMVKNGMYNGSSLPSETIILQGSRKSLAEYLNHELNIDMNFIDKHTGETR